MRMHGARKRKRDMLGGRVLFWVKSMHGEEEMLLCVRAAAARERERERKRERVCVYVCVGVSSVYRLTNLCRHLQVGFTFGESFVYCVKFLLQWHTCTMIPMPNRCGAGISPNNTPTENGAIAEPVQGYHTWGRWQKNCTGHTPRTVVN